MLRAGHATQNKRWIILLSAFTMTGVAFVLQQLSVFQSTERTILDQFFRLRSSTSQVEPPPAVTIVGITESDLETLGSWPLSDSQLAKAIQQIQQAQPAVIGLNLHRDAAISSGKAELLAEHPNLIAVKKSVVNGQQEGIPALDSLQQAGQVGISDLVLDSDGKLRRHLLSVTEQNGEVVLSLGARLALEYLYRQNIYPQIYRQNIYPPIAEKLPGHIQIGQARFVALDPFDGGYANADVGGFQILSNFYSSPQVFEHLSFAELMSGQVDPERLRDRIVLIGATAPSLHNHFLTSASLGTDEGWYGVELQADLAGQIIAAATGDRRLLQGVPRSINTLWILLWAGGSAWLSNVWNHRQSSNLILLALGATALLSSGYLIFLQGWWIWVAAPGFAGVAAGLMSQRWGLKQSLQQSQSKLQEYGQTLESTIKERTQAQVEALTQTLKAENQNLSQTQAELKTALACKQNFLARTSHELRTPLNAMLGFSQLMVKDPKLSKQSRQNLEIIQHSSEHLLELVNDALELSKIEADQSPLREQIVTIERLIQYLKQLFDQKAQEKGLTFRCSLDNRLPRHIWIDETKLRQVLINLLGNAIKFTQYGHVILRVWCQDNCPGEIYFAVEDSGPGLLESELETVFEPYKQGLAANTKQLGTGLGLSISRELTQLMGGELSVQSKPGRGAIFQVVLPLRSAELKPSVISHPQDLLFIFEEHRGKRLLVADDISFNRRLLTQLLADTGIEVREVSNGQDAIAVWKSWSPHLILMDMRMPKLDGYEATRQIRAQESEGELRPIILATSAGLTPEEEAKALTVGCNGIVHKPFRRHQLLTSLAEMLTEYGPQ